MRNARQRCRDDYRLHLEAQYEAAMSVTNGALLNARGRALGTDTFSLFYGPMTRPRAYASEELLEFWQRSPRVTFERFERQSCDRSW